jgi:hypothetical protein
LKNPIGVDHPTKISAHLSTLRDRYPAVGVEEDLDEPRSSVVTENNVNQKRVVPIEERNQHFLQFLSDFGHRIFVTKKIARKGGLSLQRGIEI